MMNPEDGWLPYYCSKCGKEVGSWYYKDKKSKQPENSICWRCKGKPKYSSALFRLKKVLIGISKRVFYCWRKDSCPCEHVDWTYCPNVKELSIEKEES